MNSTQTIEFIRNSEYNLIMTLINKKHYDSAVLMSVYQNDKPLPLYCSLWSLVHQSSKNHFIFINIDGYVNRNIANLLHHFEKKYDYIKVNHSAKNIGLAGSLNNLIEYTLKNFSDVEFLFRMDADDLCKLNRIEKQKEFLISNPCVDVLGGSCKEFGIFNKVIVKHERDYLIKRDIIKITPFIHPSVVFRKRVFLNGIRYPERTHLSEDLSLWLSLSLSGYIFHNIPDVVLYYRLNANTLNRRMGLSKAKSEFAERFNYVCKSKNSLLLNLFYCVAHFTIRLLPVSVCKILYRMLR